jgi:ATP-dependent DNA helicase RecG
MRESEDGFYIAEQDLIQRGGGEILGVRQSGEQTFIFADLERDLDLLVESNKKAQEILSKGKITEDSMILKLFSNIPQKGEVLE